MDDTLNVVNANTPDYEPYERNGKTLCGAKRRVCSCGHRYHGNSRSSSECPKCGEDRRCTHEVMKDNRRSQWHGGYEPSKHGFGAR